MKKFIKLISCSVIAMTLIAAMQLCVMAAVNDNVNSPAVSYPTVSDIDPVTGVSGVSGLHNDITPYDTTGNPNPRTGVQNLAIPGVVAMLAAATAAVTLAGKKK